MDFKTYYTSLEENIEKKMPYLVKTLQKGFPDWTETNIKSFIELVKHVDPIAKKTNGDKTPFINQIITWYIHKKIRLPEDGTTVRDVLMKYIEHKNKLKDISHYSSPGEIRKAVEDIEGEKKENKDYEANAFLEFTEGNMKVYRISTWEQGKICFADSGWCVQQQNYFEDYQPPYFMVTEVRNGQEKRLALIHRGSFQIKDVHDDPIVAPEEIAKLKPVIDKLFSHINDQIKQGKVVFDEDSDILPFLSMEQIGLNPRLSYEYARAQQEYEGKNRAPELEPYIMKSPMYAFYYAKHILRERWPEAEPYLMKDGKFATLYTRDVLHARWPEAEPYIMKDAQYACDYAEHVIKGRWPEAEPTMKMYPRIWEYYERFLQHLSTVDSKVNAAG
jgi:hypothetical protein